jgi:hypothetical protein
MRHTILRRFEGRAVVQIGRVHNIPGGAKLVGEREDAGRQPVRVMEKQNLSHERRMT